MIESIQLFLPEIFLSAASLVLFALDGFRSRRARVAVFIGGVASLLIALLMVFSRFGIPGYGFSGLMSFDRFSNFFKMVALLGGILVLLLSEDDDSLFGEHAGSYAALVLFSIVGTMLLAGASDFLMVFVGLELTTIPLFVLAGFLRKDLRSSEGAIKFFLMGAFSTGLILYGISILYGLCGSTGFEAIRNWFLSVPGAANNVPLIVGLLFVVAGLAFKLTLVPFHQWAPDAYEGSPTPITAFFSISRDAGVFVVALRFFGDFVRISPADLTIFFVVLSVITMTAGNLMALKQDNLKRLLAYSSIAHAGNILIGVVAGNVLGREGVMLYALAYTLMSIGAFAVVIVVSRAKKSGDISAFQGLAKEDLPMALFMFLFLMALAGVPPTLGFFGKFYVLAAAVESRMYWLAAIALVNSVVAVYYYFRIVHKMFFEAPVNYAVSDGAGSVKKLFPTPAGWGARAAILLSAVLVLGLGIVPERVLAWILSSPPFVP